MRGFMHVFISQHPDPQTVSHSHCCWKMFKQHEVDCDMANKAIADSRIKSSVWYVLGYANGTKNRTSSENKSQIMNKAFHSKILLKSDSTCSLSRKWQERRLVEFSWTFFNMLSNKIVMAGVTHWYLSLNVSHSTSNETGDKCEKSFCKKL